MKILSDDYKAEQELTFHKQNYTVQLNVVREIMFLSMYSDQCIVSAMPLGVFYSAAVSLRDVIASYIDEKTT